MVLALAPALAGCPRERRGDDTPSERRPHTPVRDKALEPESQVWPLALWLDELARRNGVVVRYDDRDVSEGEVVSPGPGPFDSDAEARGALEQVLRRFDLRAVEEKTHVFRVKRGVVVR